MTIPFAKMHGCGNDYVFVDIGLTDDGVTIAADERAPLARRVSDRHTGIGSDGLILLDRSASHAARMIMFNADGSEGMLCLNGLRCAALYASRRLNLPASFTIETASGPRPVRVESGDGGTQVTVEAGEPDFRRSSIPAIGDAPELWEEPFSWDGGTHSAPGFGVTVGNPHLVLWLEDAETLSRAPLALIGAPLAGDPRFPDGINVHLAALVSEQVIRMRSWERGSGATQACGSGAVGTYAVGRRLGQVGNAARIEMPGGSVEMRADTGGALTLTGPAVEVFSGSWPKG